MLPAGLEEFEKEPQTIEIVADQAGNVRAAVHGLPSHLRLYTRSGYGPRGAFAQVIIAGPGAGAWEFGTRTRRAHGSLRNALRG